MKLRIKKPILLMIIAAIMLTLLLPASALGEEFLNQPAFYHGTLKMTNADGSSTFDIPAGAMIKAYFIF